MRPLKTSGRISHNREVNDAVPPTSLPIEDPGDDRVADFRALTDLDLRTKFEPPAGLFIGEGELVIRRALRAGFRMRALFLDEKRVGTHGHLASHAPCYSASRDILQEVTGYDVHRGILASFHRRELPLPTDLLTDANRVVLLEGINNHTNIGAIFRVVAGLGFDAVLLSPDSADPLYRRSVRVSMGEVFAIPYAFVDQWEKGLQLIAEHGFSLLGMSPSADAIPLSALSAAQRRRPALLFGAEGPGLTPQALKACEATVAIPMHAGVDSLNVASSAAVACWELTQPPR